MPDERPGYFALEPRPAGYIGYNLFRPRAQITIGDLLLANPHPNDFNGSLWTLFYEGSCYFFVATAGLLSLLRGRGRYLWLILFLSATLIIHPLALTGFSPALTLRLFDTPGKIMAWHFAAGMTCSIFPSIKNYFERHHWSALTGFIVLAAGWRFGFGNLVSPLAVPTILFWVAKHLPVYQWEKQVGGDYSYGLYVYGYPVQQLLAHFGVHHWGFAVFTLLSLVGALLFAWASWRLVEAPSLRLKNIFGPEIVPAPA